MSKNNYKNPSQVMQIYQHRWRQHYQTYLFSLASQLFEWKNLPPSVDPRYLEQTLHTHGYLAFYKDPSIDYVVVAGALSGTIDHYNLPSFFQASAPNYNKMFRLYHYSDMKDERCGVLIRNNDLSLPTVGTIDMFAEELAEIKAITRVNLNAQKTPVLIGVDALNEFSMKQIYNQYEGNAPVIMTSKQVDPNSIKVHKTDAPYVVDKINTHRMQIWNELMTFFGINNTNVEKRERMVTDEVTSNNGQVENSANIMLKSRQDAVVKINELYGLEIEVCIRSEVVKQFITEGGGNLGTLHHATTGNDRTLLTE